MAKYNSRTYKNGPSPRGRNMNLKFITCEDKICIASIILSYVWNKGYTYLFSSNIGWNVSDDTHFFLCWYGIRNTVLNRSK